jgi:hypothetical protein
MGFGNLSYQKRNQSSTRQNKNVIWKNKNTNSLEQDYTNDMDHLPMHRNKNTYTTNKSLAYQMMKLKKLTDFLNKNDVLFNSGVN